MFLINFAPTSLCQETIKQNNLVANQIEREVLFEELFGKKGLGRYVASGKRAFLKSLRNNPNINTMLKQAGFTDNEIPGIIQKLKAGDGIDGYQVHHKIPLDFGGDNSFQNLVLMKHNPYHKAISSYHISQTKSAVTTQPQMLNFPRVNGSFYSPPYIE